MEAGPPAQPTYAEAAMVDVRQLASILMQSKGPIIDRIARQVRRFEGDGSIDVTEWLKDVDRLCLLERVRPTEVVEHLLGGGALRLFRSLMVGDANQWDVVQATLLAQYGLDPQEAWGRFTARKLLPGEAVDVFIDDLVRLGARFGVSPKDKVFRVKLLNGLPPTIFKWAVTRGDVYSMDHVAFAKLLRDRMTAHRVAAAGPSSGAVKATAAVSGRQQRRVSPLDCHRCGGPHRVKDCPAKKKTPGPSVQQKTGPAGSKPRRGGCFRCGDEAHFARDCPVKIEASSAPAAAGFPTEDLEGASTSSAVEGMEV